MKFGKFLFSVLPLIAFIVGAACCGSADAHNVFKKELSKKYPNMKVTCFACHVNKKPKTERNQFGKLFYKEFESEELTKNWKAKKGAEKKAYENEVMIPAFEKALVKVTAMTYDDIIKAGLVNGIDDPAAEKDEDAGDEPTEDE